MVSISMLETGIVSFKEAHDTFEAGKRLGRTLGPGSIVALCGPLAAGKTVFTKGIASALGIRSIVASPTFTMINEYKGRIPLYHFDLYRLTDKSALEGIGYEEYFEGKGICVVEWADKFPDVFPSRTIWIRLEHGDDGERTCSMTGIKTVRGRKR